MTTLRACIRRGTLSGAFVPVLAGSAFKNRGVEPLLDAVVHYLPGPEDGSRPDQPQADPAGPFAALAFKVVSDAHGSKVFVRVYRGRLRPGASQRLRVFRACPSSASEGVRSRRKAQP